MKIDDRIQRITQERSTQGLSLQQLADMSQLSVSTVYRSLTGKTAPAEYTLQVMEQALGITEKPVLESGAPFPGIDPASERYINTLLLRIDRLRAHYNMLLASKNRCLLLSFSLNLIFAMFLIGWLIFDLRNPNIGWIQGGL